MCFQWQFATILFIVVYFEGKAETEEDKLYNKLQSCVTVLQVRNEVMTLV